MKVCIATTSYPRWEGDHRATFVFEFSKALKKQGHDVRVVSMHYPGSRVYEVLEGIEVFRPRYLPEGLEVLQKEDGGLPVTWQKYPLARLALVPFFIVQVLSIIRYSKDCDLIHANWSLTGITTWLGKVFHRKPYVVTVHGSDVFMGRTIPGVSWITKHALNASETVIAVSKSLAVAIEKMGVLPEKIKVIPNGVNTDVFFPAAEYHGNDILFVGNITENKGLRTLILAFAEVVKQVSDTRLVIVGDGPKKASFEALAQQLNIAERVVFTGSKPPYTIVDFMQHAALFVLPSLSEGFGVVLLEALACGVPCIGTSVGGIPEILDKNMGLIVPPGDSLALEQAIVDLINDPTRRSKMRQYALNHITCHYAWPIISNKILEVYQKTEFEKMA